MVWAGVDAVSEGVAGDAPGDVVGEAGVGGAGGVGAAGDGVVDGVLCDSSVARVLLLMVLGMCPCLLWQRLGGLLVCRLWGGAGDGVVDAVGLRDVGVVPGVGVRRCRRRW